MAPMIQKLIDDGYSITIVDTDSLPAVAEKYQVETLPTFIMLKASVESDRLVGVVSEAKIRELFTKIPDYKIW
jgi:thioredoxin-like negative regulator of GroEL